MVNARKHIREKTETWIILILRLLHPHFVVHQVKQPGLATIARLRPVGWWSQVILACSIFWLEVTDADLVAPAKGQILELKRLASDEEAARGDCSALDLSPVHAVFMLFEPWVRGELSGGPASHCYITFSSVSPRQSNLPPRWDLSYPPGLMLT